MLIPHAMYMTKTFNNMARVIGVVKVL